MSWLLPLLIGLVSGILSAWGVGGGTLLLLLMTLLLGVEQQEARMINLLFFLPTAASGLIIHWRKGHLDLPLWRASVWPAAAGALAGSWAAMALDPELLRRPFGLFLLWIGLSTLFRRKKSGDPPSSPPSAHSPKNNGPLTK